VTGFSADWLRLREPFDRAAREAALLAPAGGGRDRPDGADVAASDRRALGDVLADWRRGRGELAVIDLGAGTGANLRFTAPRLGGAQRWTLVDNDPALLGLAAAETRAWARAGRLQAAETRAWAGTRAAGIEPAETRAAALPAAEIDARARAAELPEAGETGILRVHGPALDCRVMPLGADLATALDGLPLAGCDLITASALLDLVSPAWLARLVALARTHGCALLAALTYDGRIRWDPPDADDERLRALVNRHQRTDKGFGPALGPAASNQAIALMQAAGYHVVAAASDWRLGPADREVQRALLEGWVDAARAIEPACEGWLGRWQEHRLALIEAGRSGLTVGHQDLFGSPAG
jgi:SAM-dependent methyltransferase